MQKNELFSYNSVTNVSLTQLEKLGKNNNFFFFHETFFQCEHQIPLVIIFSQEWIHIISNLIAIEMWQN